MTLKKADRQIIGLVKAPMEIFIKPSTQQHKKAALNVTLQRDIMIILIPGMILLTVLIGEGNSRPVVRLFAEDFLFIILTVIGGIVCANILGIALSSFSHIRVIKKLISKQSRDTANHNQTLLTTKEQRIYQRCITDWQKSAWIATPLVILLVGLAILLSYYRIWLVTYEWLLGYLAIFVCSIYLGHHLSILLYAYVFKKYLAPSGAEHKN